ncbi:hypothetical protein [Komagataeibacter sp. FNDCR2]|uniref:hypothetical protein n=1 Tax=Komagataeibacter sp. FNDCR2 TaxID=2878682 RepID=UPI001E427F2B|nr:hypothetical protein [Komagataeibacter sp. FNDCR2]MCE2576682.1 hypothetical protein [Komagataeibacter sp. FNDCR2]
MSDPIILDQLIRIRQATERGANKTISVEDYNAVVRQNEALQQEVMQLRSDTQYWERQSNKFERNRDEFSDYAESLKAERNFFEQQSDRWKTRAAELEKELAALKGRKA